MYTEVEQEGISRKTQEFTLVECEVLVRKWQEIRLEKLIGTRP